MIERCPYCQQELSATGKHGRVSEQYARREDRIGELEDEVRRLKGELSDAMRAADRARRLRPAWLEWQLAPYGGRPPAAKGSDTSEAAAESVARAAPRLREQVLSAISEAGPRGATVDELQQRLGMLQATCSARCTELLERGLIEDSGQRRPTRRGRSARVLTLSRGQRGFQW